MLVKVWICSTWFSAWTVCEADLTQVPQIIKLCPDYQEMKIYYIIDEVRPPFNLAYNYHIDIDLCQASPYFSQCNMPLFHPKQNPSNSMRFFSLRGWYLYPAVNADGTFDFPTARRVVVVRGSQRFVEVDGWVECVAHQNSNRSLINWIRAFSVFFANEDAIEQGCFSFQESSVCGLLGSENVEI